MRSSTDLRSRTTEITRSGRSLVARLIGRDRSKFVSDFEQESPAIPSGVDDESSAGRDPLRSTNGMAPRRAFEFLISRIRKSFALYAGPIPAYGCRSCDSRPA